jgi:transposase InsO family protein
MRIHANAALSLTQRRRMVRLVVEDGWSITDAAVELRISWKTCSKWVSRYRDEGERGLRDRSSAPRRQARQTCPRRVEVIRALRRLRFTGPEIAAVLAMPESTTSEILKREGMGKLGRLGLEPAVRYERERPGELVHIDIKKLGRIQGGAGKRIRGGGLQHYQPTITDLAGKRRNTVGWEFVHIAIDDYSRMAYAEVLGDEKAVTAIGFLGRAVEFFARYGVRVETVMTDNGSAYVSTAHAIACRALGIRHLRTRPRRPQTNGKAERFIRTMLNGWAYGPIYGSSRERTAALDGWIWTYNHHRRHSGIGRKTPITRLNNLTGSYT